MVYEFKLSEYGDYMDDIDEEYVDVLDGCDLYVTRQKDADYRTVFYASPIRITVPAAGISIRSGMYYYASTEDYPTWEDMEDSWDGEDDSINVYELDEKNPKKVLEIFSNTSEESVIRRYAAQKGVKDPDDIVCYIDTAEFDPNYIAPLQRKAKNALVKKYDGAKLAAVLRAYLVDGLSNRAIDKDVLGLDSEKTRGYESMGILHHYGLGGAHKGILKRCSGESGLQKLRDAGTDDFSEIIALLENN